MSHHHRHHHHPYFLLAGAMARPAPLPPPLPQPTTGLKSRSTLADQLAEVANLQYADGREKPKLRPLDWSQRTGNELRPEHFSDMIGQARLRPFLERLVETARATNRPLDSMLLIGPAGTGKTTIAGVVANELHSDVYMLQAPVEQSTLEELAKVAQDRDVVFVDEIHCQAKSTERRGISATPGTEVFLSILEDKRLQTATGVTTMPDITLIGASTDAGALPEPFLMRWPLQPKIEQYSIAEMAELARRNAAALALSIDPGADLILARASRRLPRLINRYVKNARSLAADHIDKQLAWTIVTELNATTHDGLTAEMQDMLRYLLHSPREVKGEVRYQASIGSIATAIGASRDQKRVALYVEPYLIQRGFVGIAHGGRTLTPKGVERAERL